MEALIGWCIAAIVGGLIGSFLPGYLRKKGENLATHEDIDKLVEQVKAVTRTTKEIEAKISDDVWNRQRQWELKRDVLFEITRKTGSLKDALTNLHAVYQADKQLAVRDSPGRIEKRIEVGGELLVAAADFDNAGLLAGLACGEEVRKAVIDFSLFTRETASRLSDGDPDAFQRSTSEFVKKLNVVTAAIRKELQIPK